MFTANSDGTYTITNDGNNQNIAKGQSYRIGIQGGANNPSKAFEITDLTATAKKMALKLTDDKDKNGIADVLEVDFNGSVIVTPTDTPTSTPSATTKPTATNTPTSTNKPTSTPTATITPTKKPTTSATPTAKPTVTSTPTVTSSPTATPKPTISATPAPTISSTPTQTPIVTVTPTITITLTPTPTAMPTGIPDDIDYDTDTDKDGLPDDLEDYYGTDKNKKDTDGDGVNDYFELMLDTDPLKKDDNGNNDFDNDGLTNAKESELGTNPKISDTDLDGLTDGVEVNLYGTNPKKYDTDDDGISDSGEISLGSNPKKKDSDILRYQTLTFYPKADSKLNGITKVEVGGYISGYIEENTKIRDISDDDPQTASIDALIGVPVDIETTGDFDSMYIKFYYEEGSFYEDDLRVLWYDEENCQYVMFDVEDSRINYDQNYFYVYTDHFSKYMLIDQGAWVKTWSKAMLQAGENSALRNSYTIEGYIWDMERLEDSDKDGLPDVLEINGMITNKGTVIKTDPNNPDTDGDGLSDGYEMGELCLTKYAFELGTFQYFVRSWYVEYGMRPDEWVFFCMRSNPMLSDSDGDGATDDVDNTPGEKNLSANYILYDNAHADNPNDPCMETMIAYRNFFKKNNIECQVLPLNSTMQINYFFEKLEYGFEQNEIVNYGVEVDGGLKSFDTVHYTCIDNIIMIYHGGLGYINLHQFSETNVHDSIKAFEFSLRKDILPECSSVRIKNIDCQICFAAKYSQTYKSFAIELLKRTNAEVVYASTGVLRYAFGFNQVFGGTYDRYFVNDRGNIQKLGGFYGFDVMDRYPCFSDYNYEIKDYPNW